MHLVSGSIRALVMGAVVLLAAIPCHASPEAAAPAPLPTPVIVAEPAPPTMTSPVRPVMKPRRPALASRRGRLVNQIAAMAHKMEGTPYVFGGTSAWGVDCSGFTMRIFSLAGIRLRRMADEQFYQGKRVAVPERGDLVFFSTYLPGPSHVGIYLGNRQFIHASSHRGVTVSSLDDGYYRSRYIGARRFF